MKKQRRNHNLVILQRKEPLANGSSALIKREKANLLIVLFSIIILLLKDMGVLTEFVVFRVLWPEVPIMGLLFPNASDALEALVLLRVMYLRCAL